MKIEKKTCINVGITVFILYLCFRYWENAVGILGRVLSAAVPLILGFVIAYLVNILMSLYEKHYFVNNKKSMVLKSRRPVCMILAFTTLIALIFILIRLVIPELISCVKVIEAELPVFMNKMIEWGEKMGVFSEETISSLEGIDWKSRVNDIVQVLASGVGNAVGMVISAISSIVSAVVTFVLGLIFAIYLLLDKEKLCGQCGRIITSYLKPTYCEKLQYVFYIVNDSFNKYIVGQCVEAVILGALCIAGMLVLQLPYAAMIGTLIGFTALIPVAGAYIGASVGAFMIFTVSPMKAVIFLIFVVCLQQLEGNLIYPKVVGSSLGLPAIWVLAAVTIGGGVLGIPGMMIGVPLTSVAYRLLKEDMRKRRKTEQKK